MPLDPRFPPRGGAVLEFLSGVTTPSTKDQPAMAPPPVTVNSGGGHKKKRKGWRGAVKSWFR